MMDSFMDLLNDIYMALKCDDFLKIANRITNMKVKKDWPPEHKYLYNSIIGWCAILRQHYISTRPTSYSDPYSNTNLYPN